jgi:hypothetical protein
VWKTRTERNNMTILCSRKHFFHEVYLTLECWKWKVLNGIAPFLW